MFKKSVAASAMIYSVESSNSMDFSYKCQSTFNAVTNSMNSQQTTFECWMLPKVAIQTESDLLYGDDQGQMLRWGDLIEQGLEGSATDLEE